MKAYTKIYFNYFNIAYNESGWHDYIACEYCGAESVDTHHINGRGKGKDVIENLIALCRKCHDSAHNEILPKNYLQEIHNRNLKT